MVSNWKDIWRYIYRTGSRVIIACCIEIWREDMYIINLLCIVVSTACATVIFCQDVYGVWELVGFAINVIAVLVNVFVVAMWCRSK